MRAVPMRVQAILLGVVAAGGIFAWSGPESSTLAAGAPAAMASPKPTVAGFCERHGEMRDLVSDMYTVPPPEGLGRRVGDLAATALENGPPEPMPAKAQEGFRSLMTALTKLPRNADDSDLAMLEQALSLGDTSGASAFNDYTIDACSLD